MKADQRRAAALLAAGRLQRDVATEIKVSERTIGRWLKEEEFCALVREQRSAIFPADGVPTAEGALLDALSAVKADGSPDHNVRVQAARAIMGSPVSSPEAQEQVRETTIYVQPDDEPVTA